MILKPSFPLLGVLEIAVFFALFGGMFAVVGSPQIALADHCDGIFIGCPDEVEGSGHICYAYDPAKECSGTDYVLKAGASSAPIVNTTPASDITSSGARLGGTVNPNNSPTTAWFRWGPAATFTDAQCASDSEGTKTPDPPRDMGSGSSEVVFTHVISGLSLSTEYRFCAIAENANGKNSGSALTFTTASGAAPKISVSPVSMIFPDTETETGASFLSGTVYNIGGGALSGSMSGLDAPFFCSGGCSYNIPAGASQTFTIKFAPESVGDFADTAQFSGGGEASMNVSGRGVAPGSTILRLTPVNYSFGSAPAGSTQTQNLTLTHNAGSGLGTVSGTLTISLPFFCASGCGYTLSAGASQTVRMEFRPTAAGFFTQSVMAPHSISGGILSGEGTAVSGSDDSGTELLPITVKFPNPLGYDSFSGLVNALINFLFTLAVIGAPILLVIAGVVFMTAAGDPSRVASARRMLLWTVIGFGIILISKGLVEVLKAILGI